MFQNGNSTMFCPMLLSLQEINNFSVIKGDFKKVSICATYFTLLATIPDSKANNNLYVYLEIQMSNKS